jgi:hypothetical protein
LLGLIPGVGDTLGLLLSAYILFEARNLGAPPALLLRMATNIGIDALVGTIPLLGDIFDLAWKANRKNMHLLQTHLASQHRTSGLIRPVPPLASRAVNRDSHGDESL